MSKMPPQRLQAIRSLLEAGFQLGELKMGVEAGGLFRHVRELLTIRRAEYREKVEDFPQATLPLRGSWPTQSD